MDVPKNDLPAFKSNIVKIVEYSLPQDIGFYIRIKDSYTFVSGRLQ
jgi:hypothetical protein